MPAVSKAQQKFMGMVHAAQKGEEPASPEVAKVAKEMDPKDAKDFASTKHKGLPMKKETITKERLKELVKEVMVEEAEYQAFFKKALEKAGKSISQMSDDEKKEFFNKIDSAWNGKGTKSESVNEYNKPSKEAQAILGKIQKILVASYSGRITPDEFLDQFAVLQKQLKNLKEAELTGKQHKLDVDNDGDIEGDDLADLRAGKKKDEAVSASLPQASIPSSVKTKLTGAIDKIKDAKLNNLQKLQLVAQVVDAIGVDKSQLGNITTKIRSKMESK
jgi:hypothetical protein